MNIFLFESQQFLKCVFICSNSGENPVQKINEVIFFFFNFFLGNLYLNFEDTFYPKVKVLKIAFPIPIPSPWFPFFDDVFSIFGWIKP